MDLLRACPEGLGIGCASAERPVLLGVSWAQDPLLHWTGVPPSLPLTCSSLLGSREPLDLLVGSLSVFALKGRQGCQVLWGLRKEEATLLDWGVEDRGACTWSKKRWCLGPGLPQAPSVSLEASVIPTRSPGAEPGPLLLVLGWGGWLVLHFTGDLTGRNLFPYPLPSPPWFGLGGSVPSHPEKAQGHVEVGAG